MWFIFTGAIFAGIIYSSQLGNTLRYPDEQHYLTLAQNLAAHARYSFDAASPTAYRPPGYPLLLAGFVALRAEVWHLRLLNFCFLACSIWLLAKILQEHASKRAAVLAGVLVLGYPVLFYAAGTLYPQMLGGFLLLLAIRLLLKDRKTNRHFLLAGLVLGALVLTIPAFIFTSVVLLAWLWFSATPAGKKKLVLTFVCSASLVVAWSVRNYLALGQFVFISSNSGINLLLGNSENTTPNAGINVDISQYGNGVQRLGEAAADAYYRKKALEYMATHKWRTAKLYAQKFLNHFNYRNELWKKSEASAIKDWIMLLTWGPLLLLFMARLAFIRKIPPASVEWLFIGLYFAGALFSAIFFTRIRFRLPYDFLLIGINAIFVDKSLRFLFNADDAQ